jgi:predicted O-methyltransferase YrrM
MTIVFSAMLLTLLLLAAFALHKLRRVHLMLYAIRDQGVRESENLYRQLELLDALYRDVGFEKSLPGTRGWAASPDFLMVLVRHALEHKPSTVLECSSGTSTVVLARCMQKNGHGMVYSLEHDPVYAQRTIAQLERHGLSDWARVLVAPIGPVDVNGKSWPWYDLSALPVDLGIDMLAIDGPPASIGPLARYPAGPALFNRLRPNGAIFLDDAARDDEVRIVQQWLEQFPQYEQTDMYCEKGCTRLIPRAELTQSEL